MAGKLHFPKCIMYNEVYLGEGGKLDGKIYRDILTRRRMVDCLCGGITRGQ
jgi:hypothetical protein